MPTIQGVGGSVTLPSGFNARLYQWTAQLTVETVDTTSYADQGYRTREPTMLTLAGSATGVALHATDEATPLAAALLSTSASLSSAKGAITLQASTGCSYSFNAIMKRVEWSRPAQGQCEVIFEFESTGPITQTWNETA